MTINITKQPIIEVIMKKNTQVLSGEKNKPIGDLTVEGNVAERAVSGAPVAVVTTITQTREKISTHRNMQTDLFNFDFSTMSPQQALAQMAETRKYFDTHKIVNTQTLTADNILETTHIETEIPAHSHSSQSQSIFFQPSTGSTSSTVAAPRASQPSSSSNSRGNSGIVSEIRLEGSCRPHIQSSVGQVKLPPGMALPAEMAKMVQSYQNKIAQNTIQRVVITNPSDAELIASAKSLVEEKLNVGYNDKDVTEIADNIKAILTSYESSRQLSSEQHANLNYQLRDLKELCDYFDSQAPVNVVTTTTSAPAPQQQIATTSTSSKTINPKYGTGDFEKDLEVAIANSLNDTNAASLSARLGVFATTPQTTASTLKQVPIPKAFECPITQDVMVKPVMLITDGRSYEELAIKDWLMKHNTSPYNRAPIPAGMTVDQVLVFNRTLADSIDEFKQEHPELFSANGMAI